MRFLVLLVLCGCLVNGKGIGKKEKAKDIDFSFEELEPDAKSKPGKHRKTWIWDPSSDLCFALNCRKSEKCLLEDELTAVCVSTSELKRTGDVIIPKSEAPVQKNKPRHPKFSMSGEPTWAELKDCTPCPVVKPEYICGSDNNTYSSQCKLDYSNCMHDSHVSVACQGFCPCAESKKMNMSRFVERYSKPIEKKRIKEKSTVVFSPEAKDFAKQLVRVNGELDKIKTNNRKKEEEQKTCSDDELSVMGDRMLDWFSVVMSSAKKERASKRNKKSKVSFPASCPKEVQWMLGHLDSNGDAQLSLKELYALEHDKYEPCIKPLLDRCDTNEDIFLSGDEWCSCFKKSRRPCTAMKKKISPGLLGAYKPSCDPEGFFKRIQCHSAVGLCWCVDKHGFEVAGSRTRGKPDCDPKKSTKTKSGNMIILDDDSYVVLKGEGSGDGDDDIDDFDF